MPSVVTPEIDTLARTLYGEARGEGRGGMELVASAIMNRVKFAQARGGYWWGYTVQDVCLMPWQFSCWNVGDPNRPIIETVTVADDPAFGLALKIAGQAVRGELADLVNGATHYHNATVLPAWAGQGARVASSAGHVFYAGIA